MDNQPSAGQPQNGHAKMGFIGKEFVCGPGYCQPDYFRHRLGHSIATALSGFAAGAVVAGLILLPWLFFMGKACLLEQ